LQDEFSGLNAVEIGGNCIFQVSQGSVKTYLSWRRESLRYMCTISPEIWQ